MTEQKYVPELNYFLRRWRHLGGPPEIKAIFQEHSDNPRSGPGIITFSENDPLEVVFRWGDRRRGWCIRYGAQSAKINLRIEMGEVWLEVSDFYGASEIRDSYEPRQRNSRLDRLRVRR